MTTWHEEPKKMDNQTRYQKKIDEVREQILFALLLMSVILGSPAILASLWRQEEFGFQFLLVSQILFILVSIFIAPAIKVLLSESHAIVSQTSRLFGLLIRTFSLLVILTIKRFFRVVIAAYLEFGETTMSNTSSSFSPTVATLSIDSVEVLK